MNRIAQRWACGFLSVLLAMLLACGGIVYAVDPCLYYRVPDTRLPVFFSERYQAAGLVKNVPANTVLLGTSMAANYRPAYIEKFYHTPGLRITIPDGAFSEFDQVMDLLFQQQEPQRILFALDLNTLIREDPASVMPDYVYNRNPLDDVKYLLNKDCLYYSFYVLLEEHRGGGQTLEEGFTWDLDSTWGKYEAMRTYVRPPMAEEPLPEDAYLAHTDENLAVMSDWFQAHPDTKFEIFFSPYSILFWDRVIRQGELDARLAAIERACETLMSFKNVRVHMPLFCQTMITELNNYCDYIHHSGDAASWVLGNLCGEKFLLRPEDVKKTVADWRAFVVNYDYNALWDQEFWDQWNALHDGPPDWYEAP